MLLIYTSQPITHTYFGRLERNASFGRSTIIPECTYTVRTVVRNKGCYRLIYGVYGAVVVRDHYVCI